MSKEHLYIADSGIDPSPITPAQKAFFRWRCTVGSFEYAEKHGSSEVARSLFQEVSELYEAYRALRDEHQEE